MKIEDSRKETSYIPAIECLQDIIPLIEKFLHGIRKVVLLDYDYKKRGAIGRYHYDTKTKYGEIELFFDCFQGAPKELIENRYYLINKLTETLGHEIYHHVLNYYRYEKPKKEHEERQADEYAHRVLNHVIYNLFTKEQVDCEHEKMLKIINEKR